MTETMEQNGRDFLVELTAEVVAAYVSNNVVPTSELPSLIADVHSALGQTKTGVGAAAGRKAEAGGAGSQVAAAGLHHLSRRRTEVQVAEAASDDSLRHDAGGVPREVGIAGRLSDGGARLCRRPARGSPARWGSARSASAASSPATSRLPAMRRKESRGVRPRLFCFRPVIREFRQTIPSSDRINPTTTTRPTR